MFEYTMIGHKKKFHFVAFSLQLMIPVSYTDSFDKNFLLDTMMGPNAMRITEELASFLPMKPGMRVLDLGCGMGLSSILLADKFNVNVFAADLWISPTDNLKRFRELKLDDRIIPFHLDATKDIGFAHDFFDLLITVDSYHYFGNNDIMLPKLLPFVKPGGYVAVAVPGLKKDFPDGQIPDEIKPFGIENFHFYSCDWWRTLWKKESCIEITSCREMDCFRQAWDDWLESPNPYAQSDIAMMKAEGGKYFNLLQIVGRKKADIC